MGPRRPPGGFNLWAAAAAADPLIGAMGARTDGHALVLGIRKCVTIANFSFQFAPCLGSGDSGVRKYVTVANFSSKFAPRLGSGDSDDRKCATVANFRCKF